MNTAIKQKTAKLRSLSHKTERTPLQRTFQSALYALAISLVLAALLLVILAAIAYQNPDPDTLVLPFSYLTLFLSVFVGGIVAARINRQSGLVSGALFGLLFLLVIFTISLFYDSESSSVGFATSLIFYTGIVLTAAIGGFFGMRLKRPTGKIHTRRRKSKLR